MVRVISSVVIIFLCCSLTCVTGANTITRIMVKRRVFVNVCCQPYRSCYSDDKIASPVEVTTAQETDQEILELMPSDENDLSPDIGTAVLTTVTATTTMVNTASSALPTASSVLPTVSSATTTASSTPPTISLTASSALLTASSATPTSSNAAGTISTKATAASTTTITSTTTTSTTTITSTTTPMITTTVPTTTTTCAYSLCETTACKNNVAQLDAAIQAVPAVPSYPAKLTLSNLNGTYYYFEKSEKKTYFEALTFCRSYNMDLVTVNSQEEQNAINTKLTELGIFGSMVYLSANKIGPICPYTWVDGSPLNYTNWKPNEPSESTAENCLRTTNGYWYDLPCTYSTYFICEVPPNVVICPIACTTQECKNSLDTFELALNASVISLDKLNVTYLNGDYYFYSETAMNWYDAYAFCKSHNMELVSIETAGEQALLDTYLTSIGKLSTEVFTIGNKIGGQCEYKWNYNTTFSYVNWKSGEPSDPNMECMIMVNGNWSDHGCATLTNFMCEQLPCQYSKCTSCSTLADLAAAIKNVPAEKLDPATLTTNTFNGKLYYFHSSKKSWFDALTFCRSYGMELLIIENQEEQDFINDQLTTLGIVNTYVFVGAHKIGPICPYKWLDDTHLFTYTNWELDEPSQSKSENCMIVWKKKWYDFPCALDAYFICKQV